MRVGAVLAEHRQPAPPRGGDVISQVHDAGWVIPFAAGQFLYRGPWVRLTRALQEHIVGRARELGFEEWIFPRLLPRTAVDSFQLTQYTPDLLVDAGVEQSHVLDPVQCVSLYHALRGRRLQAKDLPLRAVETLGGWTWRNETPERMEGPYRAVEFNRVEHVFIGTPDEVRANRAEVRDMLLELLTGLGLSWQLVVGSGCMEIPSVESARDGATTLEDVPVQDIEVPIRGALSRDERPSGFAGESHERLTDEGLISEPNDAFYLDTDEISGCSVEGDHLTERFGLSRSDGEPLWSGCCGIGLNRLVLGLLYQHGLDAGAWPDELQKLTRASRGSE